MKQRRGARTVAFTLINTPVVNSNLIPKLVTQWLTDPTPITIEFLPNAPLITWLLLLLTLSYCILSLARTVINFVRYILTELKGLKVNIEKTKVMRSGKSGGEIVKTGRWPCAVCGKGIRTNSI